MNEVVEFIAKHKAVVICRGLYDSEPIKTIRAPYDDGMRVVEVTSGQADPDAVEKTYGAIRTIKEYFPWMEVGSGTVTCVKHVLVTKKIGEEFRLSPDMNMEVIHATEEAGLVSIPGATTLTETLQARNVGTDIVKTFPVEWLGLSYLKNIKGPISHVKFLAAAGVNEENLREHLNVGCCIADTSGRFIDREVIAEGNLEELIHRARIFIDIANAY